MEFHPHYNKPIYEFVIGACLLARFLARLRDFGIIPPLIAIFFLPFQSKVALTIFSKTSS